MTVEEIRERRLLLARAIAQQLQLFTEETGCRIDDVALRTIDAHDMSGKITVYYDIRVDIRL